MSLRTWLCAILLTSSSTLAAAPADLLLRGGWLVDGSGSPARQADIAIHDCRITAIGQLNPDAAREVIDVSGLTVTPGFINMLSWAAESLLQDGHSQSDIRQGVTLEVFGEGESMGPVNARMRAHLLAEQGDFKYAINWHSLDGFLARLQRQGVAPNIASFVGASSVRRYVLGDDPVKAGPAQLQHMRRLVRTAMADGAMGLGAALIYAPGAYADTHELLALTEVVAAAGGVYSAHIRSEGDRIESAVDELLDIAARNNLRAHIHHLKVSGQANWPKLPAIINSIERARAAGQEITANIYTYTAGSTGLDAAMPPWVQAGGIDAWVRRLQDPADRARVLAEMHNATPQWDNLLQHAGPQGTLLVGFKNPELRHYTGQTLAAVAAQRGSDPYNTAIDLVIADHSEVQVVYELMSPANLRRKLQLPWVAFGSDARSMAASGTFLAQSTHPRAYGNFARLLGRYVRDEGLLSLPAAVHRLTALPADILQLRDRGRLQPGFFADIAVFDARRIQDTATYTQPHSYALGMQHVLVNGQLVLRDGQMTGALPGRVVRGPGWRGWSQPKNTSSPLCEASL